MTADSLSRGVIPRWLKQRGIEQFVDMKKFDNILSYPIKFWKKSSGTIGVFRALIKFGIHIGDVDIAVSSLPPLQRCSCSWHKKTTPNRGSTPSKIHSENTPAPPFHLTILIRPHGCPFPWYFLQPTYSSYPPSIATVRSETTCLMLGNSI